MRIIVFQHSTGWGEHNSHKEVIEFEDDVTDKEIGEAFEDWVWQRIGDSVTWYDKEQP